MKHVFLFGIFGWFLSLRLSHKQESGNGPYPFVILALIPRILSQGLTCGFPVSVNK